MQIYQEELDSIKEVLRSSSRGLTITEISRALGVNRNSAAKYLDILLIAGHVEMYSLGPAKIYHLSKRLPTSDILNLSGSMMILMDSDLRILDASRPLLEMFGIPNHTIPGGRIDDYLPSEMLNQNTGVLLRAALRGVEEKQSIKLKTGTGEIHLELSILPVSLPDGSNGVAIIARDRTNQVMLENALRDSEERFSLLSEAVSEGVAILQNKAVVAANTTLLKMLGCKKIESVGEKLPVLIPGWPGRSPRQADTYTVQLRKAGNSTGRVEVSTSLTRYNGGEAVLVLVRPHKS